MSNKKMSEDDIEALASSPLHYGANPSASSYTQKAQEEAARYKENASQFLKLEQHTNKLLSDYKDFLSDIDSSASADVVDNNSSDEEEEDEEDDNGKRGGTNLATIHEDSSSFNSYSRSFNLHQSTRLDRPDYSGGHDYDFDSWDYNMNNNHNRAHQFTLFRWLKSIFSRWQLFRYGFSLKQTGWLMTIMSIIVLLVVILFVGTNTKADDDVNNATLTTPTQSNNSVSANHPSEIHNHPNNGYPDDHLDRPPSIEEDDLSNFYGANDIGEDNSIDPVYIPVDPVWFTEKDGWTGTSYLEGVNYCASMGRRLVCTYEQYCPNGPGSAPYQGVQAPSDVKDGNDEAEWLAPVYIDQPIWIGVSKTNACIWKGVLDEGDASKVKSILCCPDNTDEVDDDQSVQNHSAQTTSPTHVPTPKPTTKQTQPPSIETPPDSEESDDNASLTLTAKELAILQYMNPLWYGRKDGYLGTTHQHAVEFCKSVQGRQLCLPEAYCPNGEGNEAGDQPLFLRMDLFPREQVSSLNANIHFQTLI